LSAICGLFTKSNRSNLICAEAVYKELGKHRFDDSNFWQSNNIFLGCYLLRSVPESLSEYLPYYDEDSSLIITADAIIDNREELFTKLYMSPVQKDVPDSLLILAAYRKWGIECPNQLIGDFSFAIWDIQKQQLFCARDHVGKRSLYYSNNHDFFTFSTLIDPLFQIKELNKEPNEDFIAEFLAIPTIAASLDCSMTAYANIFQLPPASALLVDANEIKIWEYWQIKQDQPVVLKTDAEYEGAFLKIFAESVKCRLRRTKNVGIMLSGGLDSTAVASLAANELKTEGSLLYGYTQVPTAEYQNKLEKNRLANESPYVEELCNVYRNIKPSYLDSNGKNAYNEIDYLINVLEQPYKIFHNNYWLTEICREAANCNVGVLLDGQIGNVTVSEGDFIANLFDLVKQMDFKTCISEIIDYSKLHKRSFLRTFVSCVYQISPFSLKKMIYKLRGGIDLYDKLSLINPDFEKKIKPKTRISDPFFISAKGSFDERLKILNPRDLTYLGAVETKFSIEFGLVKRDPTRDKRVIEFCVNTPNNLWVRNGQERRLIRVAMKGILPDKIRLNTTVRGRQAADWMQRLIPDWHKAWQEIDTIGKYELERKYLDVPKIKDRLARNREIDSTVNDSFDIVFLIRALIFARFLRKNFPENQ